MNRDVRHAQPSVGADMETSAGTRLDPTAIELATGLSAADIELLGSEPSPNERARIAVKFAIEFDRLARSLPNKLAKELLDIFSKDPDKSVRRHFAESVKASLYLPPKIAERLALDEIDVAASILRESPVLDDAAIGEIVQTERELHALVIADRRPLSASLVDLLIKHKGTKRLVMRLLDNEEADFSESSLSTMRDWAACDGDISARLNRRPNLPFVYVDRCVSELADRVQWASLGERTMSRFEATQLQNRFDGKTMPRSPVKGERFQRLERALKDDFERGLLDPSMLLVFLRDQDVDRLECGFSIMADLPLRWVRQLLYGSDKRALTALCLKAGFSTADYLAFRIALGLAELGSTGEQQKCHYRKTTMKFAQYQFEAMRADRSQMNRWLPMALP